MAVQTAVLEVSGIRCERCVMRLGGALGSLEGIESANATLTGRVTLSWDDARVDYEAIVAAMAKAGFHPST